MCDPCYQAWYTQQKRRKRQQRKDPSEYAPNYRRPPHEPARVPDCHPDRAHVALGLCRACYQKDRPTRARAECHPDRPLVADGKCGMCLSRRRYWDDPEKHRDQSRRAQAEGRQHLRDQMVAAYGGQCSCPRCPETNPAFLTLEHVNGDGKAHRAKVGSHTYADLRRRRWPKEGYTLLCWNCNAMTRGGRTCPHEEG
jgi:hypothetical protein